MIRENVIYATHWRIRHREEWIMSLAGKWVSWRSAYSAKEAGFRRTHIACVVSRF